MYFVILESSSFGLPTSGLCAQVRAAYGLTMPVLIDPSGTLHNVLSLGGKNHRSVVFQEGMEIQYKQAYGDAAAINLLEGLLGD